MSPSPSRLRARSVDAQRPPDPTPRASVWESRKTEPAETTAHPPRKPCPLRSGSPAWGFSGLPRSSWDPSVWSTRTSRGPIRRAWSPEHSMARDQSREATALRPRKLCPSTLSSLHREAASSLSCRSQTLLQEVHLQGSLELLPRSPKPAVPKMRASEEDTALPLRRLCHLSSMEKHLGRKAHPRGSPELTRKSKVAASSQLSQLRVRSASLPPHTRLPCGSRAPAAAHPVGLSDLPIPRATTPGWRSPDPSSRLVDPPLGSTTSLSTWTAPQSRKTARPSRSREPQIRESEPRDPQSKEAQRRWKEDQRPPLRRKGKCPLQGTDPLPPGQRPPLQQSPTPGQPQPCQAIPKPQRIPAPKEPHSPRPSRLAPELPPLPQSMPTPVRSLPRRRSLTPPGQPEPSPTLEELASPAPASPTPTPGEHRSLRLRPQQRPGHSPPAQPIPAPGHSAQPWPQPTSGESRPSQQSGPCEPRCPSPGRPLSPLSPGPAASPPAPRSRLLTRLLRGLLGRLPGGANTSAAAAATSDTKSGATSATIPPATSPRTGPPAASSGSSAAIAAAESPSATHSATSSPRPSGAASADAGVPSPEPRAPPRSGRTLWPSSAARCAKKPLKCAPRSAQRRNAASSSTSNSRTRRWATCARTACCF
uniref:Uncharacterized protein n=1 Tax=Cavia porcellus TaxID=10141 RepID=A0A286Y0J9_CAVPO